MPGALCRVFADLAPPPAAQGTDGSHILAGAGHALSDLLIYTRLISVLLCSVRPCADVTLGTAEVSPFSYVYLPFEFPRFRSIHFNVVPIILFDFP